MDEKGDTAKMEMRGDKSKLVGVSMLVLSLLLTASVASLIYVALANGNQACVTSESAETDMTSTLTARTQNGEEVKERVEYSHAGEIAFFYGSDGSFDFHDFGKGVHLMREGEDGICYLIPVGTDLTVQDLEDLLKEWDGQVLTASGSNREVQVLDGKISDTSFLPEKAHMECTSGYQWMLLLEISDNEDAEEDTAVLNRKKRATPSWICRLFPHLCY